jgi:Helix-turn-helix domain
MPKIPGLYTTTEAAQELGLSPHSVRYAIGRGVLGVVELDKRTNLIPAAEVERYRREHLGQRGKRKKPPATPPAE